MLRDVTHFRLLKRTCEKVSEGSWDAGIAFVSFGSDGIEVHKPRFAQRPSNCCQRLIHHSDQLEFPVYRTEDVSDDPLLVQRARWARHVAERPQARLRR